MHTASFDCSGAGEILSGSELERAARYHFDEDRQRYVAARVALRRALAQHTGFLPGELVIGEGEFQKPKLILPPGRPPVYFNVSHSGSYAVIVVSDAGEVGIDIEEMRTDCPVTELASRFYSARESAWLRRKPPAEKLRSFYRLWTIKEAVLKCVGLGLSVPPRSVEIKLAGKGTPEVECHDTRVEKKIETLQVDELLLVDAYASALASEVKASIEITAQLA